MSTLLPWYEHPFRLISLLEMNEFSAKEFLQIGGYIAEAVLGLGGRPQTAGGNLFHEWSLDEISEFFTLLEDSASKIGLERSREMAGLLEKELHEVPIDHRDLRGQIEGLRKLVHIELEAQLFLWVPSDRASAYTQAEPYFGKKVSERFTSAEYDIEEAGKCFACARFTAAVMHSMRVLEHGLRALCQALEVPFGEGTWSRSLDRIEKRISVLDSMVKQKAAWKKKRQFYTEAVAEFKHFKNAWRNHACHGNDKYDEGRAKKIIAHTRDFMGVLSTRLREK